MRKILAFIVLVGLAGSSLAQTNTSTQTSSNGTTTNTIGLINNHIKRLK